MIKQHFAIENAGITFADSPQLDAFSRFRVSSQATLYESQAQYGLDSLRMESGNTSDGVAPSWSANTRLVTLSVAAGATGGTSFVQSFHYLPYQPGKSQFIAITGVMGAGTAGAVKRYGYGDSANGIFYEQNGTGGVRFNRRTSTSGSVVNNTVDQANWNIDKFDGTGPSGTTLDVTKDFVLVIDLQFLSMGRVRIGFDIGGRVWYAHQFLAANILSVPYMQTASLPVLGEIIAAAGLAAPATCFWKCATVSSEGGYQEGLGRKFAVEGNINAGSGARTHVLSIRPRATFNTLVNRIFVLPHDLLILAGTQPIYWELCIGVNFGATPPTWANVNATYSGMEFGINGTFVDLTNGLVIDSGYVSGGAGVQRSAGDFDITLSYPITLNRAGAVRDLGTLSVLVTGIGGASQSRAALQWSEVR